MDLNFLSKGGGGGGQNETTSPFS